MTVQRLLLPPTPVRHPGALLAEHHRQLAELYPNVDAIWTGKGSQSHQEVWQRASVWIDRLAVLLDPGINPSVCGVYCGDTFDNLYLGLALLYQGITQTILPVHAPVAELQQLIRLCSITLILADRPVPEELAFERLPQQVDSFTVWRPAPYIITPAWPLDPVGLDLLLERPAFLTITSGTTTGVPGLNKVSYLSFLAASQEPVKPEFQRSLFTLSLQFGSAKLWAFRVLLLGATLCVLIGSKREDLPAMAGEAAAQCLPVGTTFLIWMLEAHMERAFPSALRFITGSDRVPASLRHRFHGAFGERLTIVYATSQSGPLTRLPVEELLAHDGESIGWPLIDVFLALEKAVGVSDSSDEIAEVVVQKSWTVRLQDPQGLDFNITERLVDFRPGDLLRPWPDGSYSFFGRANDVFLFRSVLISPREIEDVLSIEASVREVVAFGALSTAYGAVPMAVVRLHAGIDPVAECERLRRKCQAVMGFRSPKAIRALEEIPRTATGKPLRRVLAQQFALS